MKQLAMTLLLIMARLHSSAQQYVGHMDVDGYTRDEVVADVHQSSNGVVTILLHKVKFAMLMPIKVDVQIPTVTKKGNKLTADNKVPTVKGKPYEKYTVHQLEGTHDKDQLSFTCKLGSKPFTYKGKKKEKK